MTRNELPVNDLIIKRRLVTLSFLKPILFLLLTIYGSHARSSSPYNPFIQSEKLWNEYKQTDADSVKIRLLFNLASISSYSLGNDKLADSISEIAIQLAEKINDPLLQITALNNYIESVDLEYHYKKALASANKAFKLCSENELIELKWRTLHNKSLIFIAGSYYQSAEVLAKEGLDLAEDIDNKEFQVESYLDIGKSYQMQLRMIDAFNQFNSAVILAKKMNDKRLLMKCYSQLSDFYNRIKSFDKAIEYKQYMQEIILSSHPVDSVELMWSWNKMHFILTRFNNLLDKKSIEKVIDFAIRTNNLRLKFYEFTLYRKFLIETNQMEELFRVYHFKYPEELTLLYSENRGMYYRLQAFFKTYEEQFDSAHYYFSLAEQEIRTEKNLLFKSNFYIRFGQFLKETGKTNEAIDNFTRAFTVAQSSPVFGRQEFMLTASLNLAELYTMIGDYRNAFYYSEKSSLLKDNITKTISTEKVNRMYVEYKIILETEKRNIQEKQMRNERVIYAIGVVLLLVISLLIYRNYRNQKTSNRLLDAAKKKSDELLENILPHETAEELKVHGKAKAKRFDEVTVMFTDFKDFTQISEKLSAEDLVAKIDTYFSEFDRIISKHGIEKIKIIGDSYMCAGGLPVSNKTHAYDVVSAALELQDFMEEEKARRIAGNQSYFEARIGINTGPVIAGIVGSKKFAYDIWGDTVNTAARMENTCETAKINISGSTYERIKDHFSCTYRGKVKAKHKGEIDMYFVNARKNLFD